MTGQCGNVQYIHVLQNDWIGRGISSRKNYRKCFDNELNIKDLFDQFWTPLSNLIKLMLNPETDTIFFPFKNIVNIKLVHVELDTK
jgi:hypothetical protein